MLALVRVAAPAVAGIGWSVVEAAEPRFLSFPAAGRHARIVWACYRWVGRVRD